MNAEADVFLHEADPRRQQASRATALPGGVALRLPADPEAPMLARHAAAAALSSWAAERREIALLAISELVTNAVRHGSGGPWDEVALSIRRRSAATRIEVRDAGAQGGTVASGTSRARDADAGEHVRSGWGLPIVAELTDRWGVEQHDDGTTVWCELRDEA
jgi:anti-sigma regulatory factor (Ser/Thr protein kinase)